MRPALTETFLFKCIESAIKAGATTVNIPDTVGYTVPAEYRYLITDIMNSVPNIDKARVSVHCHNDLGLAVANSLAALDAGARQIECTINGLGERAGNCSLEEIVMALKTRSDAMPYTTDVDTTQIMKASRMVSTVTGFAVQPNKAIVGANAFAHEAGIHQDGMLKKQVHLRNHVAGRRWLSRIQAGHGQAFRPPCLPRKAEGNGLRDGPERFE
jgi:2-isopropylmalate synthase